MAGDDGSPEAKGPTTIGFLIFSFFLSMWVFAQFMPVLAVYLWWKYNSYAVLAPLLAYYAYRYLLPNPKRWKAAHKWTSEKVHKYPYFKSQRLVLDIEEMPKPNSSSLFSFHMHGVLTCGCLLNGSVHPTMMKADASSLVGSGLFDISFLRDLLFWYNFLPWTREVMLSKMAKGENVIIMPGGFEEASIYKRNTHQTYLKDRKGWIKHALRYGYSIYPTYTFGEELTYWTWTGLMKYRLMLNKFQAPGAVFLGKFCTWMPANDPDLITVIGAPLELPKIEDPSNDDISKYHALYLKHLKAHFDKHKKQYCANPEAELLFVGPKDFGLKH